MQKKRDIVPDPPFFDEEERDAVEALRDAIGEALPVATPERKVALQAAGRATMNPRKRPITARLSELDLARLKARALALGVPYQTLLSSIVHQYVEGRLVEKD